MYEVDVCVCRCSVPVSDFDYGRSFTDVRLSLLVGLANLGHGVVIYSGLFAGSLRLYTQPSQHGI